MKIRIGNDIVLRVKLLGRSIIDSININSVKAYLINTTAEAAALADLNNKTRFISRFPIEPMIDAYTSTQYNINSTGYPSYHAFPNNHVIGSYAGFGYDPHWRRIYRPIPQHNLTEFLAPVKATDDKDTVEVFFPADAQLLTGDYKIVIVAKLYEPGFSCNNLRTVTMDYENIFTLVNSSEEGVDTAVTMNVGVSEQFVTLEGDTDIIAGKTYSVYADSTEGVKWFCKDSNVKFLKEFKNSLIYTVTEMPDEGKGMNFQIMALSNTDKVIGKLDVFAHNYPISLNVYVNNKPVVSPVDVNYKKTVAFVPSVTFENGETRSYTYVNGNKVIATSFDVNVSSAVAQFNTAEIAGEFMGELTSKSQLSSATIADIIVQTISKDKDGNPIIFNCQANILPSSMYTDDIHAESGDFDKAQGSIGIQLNNGASFGIDVSSETVWHEGN